VDKPLSPQAERTTPEPMKPSSTKDARGSPSDGGAPTSPTCAASGQNSTGTSSGSEPAESPEASPPSSRSYGLGATGGYQHGERSSVPQSEAQPRQQSRVAESLWDNPEFIQARFHIGQFVTVAVDTEADWENIKTLYFSLKTTSAQIDINTLKPPHYTFSAWI
jgi:hypothetical protein